VKPIARLDWQYVHKGFGQNRFDCADIRPMDPLKPANHTLVIFSSDNGPILDDGYQDQAAI